jgi:hypothetical protein
VIWTLKAHIAEVPRSPDDALSIDPETSKNPCRFILNGENSMRVKTICVSESFRIGGGGGQPGRA